MVMHVIHSLSGAQPDQSIIVVGHGADQVTSRVTADSPSWANVSFASQSIQRGTGDAVSVGLTALDQNVRSGSPAEHDDTSTILVLPGDTPLLRRETIDHLVQQHESSGHAATVLVAKIDDPTGYGRVVRAKDGRVLRIVEQRDATDAEAEPLDQQRGHEGEGAAEGVLEADLLPAAVGVRVQLHADRAAHGCGGGVVLAAEDEVPVLVFDEVDANVGGEESGDQSGQPQDQPTTRHHCPEPQCPAIHPL